MKSWLLSKRVHFFTGKGGVGKSTVSILLAYIAARAGKKVLLVDLDPHSKLGFEPKRLAQNIDGIVITPISALKEYVTQQLRFKTLSNLIFDNKLMRFFLDATPGIEEIALMGKIFYLDEEKIQNKPRWDIILIDAPATGHGLYLFKSPKIFIKITQVGPLTQQSEKIYAMLSNPKKSAIHIITLPEELPVEESFELHQDIQKSDLPLGQLFINKMLPSFPGVTTIRSANISPALKKKITQTAAKFKRRHDIQLHYKNLIQTRLQRETISIPWVLDQELTPSTLKALAEDLYLRWI